MPIELKISWEGDAPGVREHRLSIGAFAPALAELVRAYRRIASNMLRNAASYAESGRLKDLANRLDIEIQSVEGTNPLELAAVCTFDAPIEIQPPLWPVNIAERASKELLDSIEEESSGRPRNTAVRSYLKLLPPLSKQKYELHDNGRVLHDPVIIDELNLTNPSLTDLPHLIQFAGSVIGVGFEPGISEVRIRTEENETLRLLASPEMVEQALELRGTMAVGLAVKGNESRLLRLSPATGYRPFSLTPELANEYIFQRWETLLRRLS